MIGSQNSNDVGYMTKMAGKPIHIYIIKFFKPEDYWSCIPYLGAKDMLKSAVIEEKKFKHSPWADADNPLGPKF